MVWRRPQLGALPASLRRFGSNDQVVLSILAAVIGVAVAYAVYGFRVWIAAVQFGAFGFPDENAVEGLSALPWWQIVAWPAGVGLGLGLLLKFAMPGGWTKGPADAIEANALHDARIPVREGLLSALVSATSLGVGASAGREGPVVHLGASMAAWLAQGLRLSPALSRTILGCGVAAAVSASFNAPIAGVFFALEVVLGHYALEAFAPIVISSVAGAIITRIHLGDFPAFQIADYTLGSFLELPAFALLGAVCAVGSVVFMWSIFFVDDSYERLRVPTWLRPAVAGVLVGGIGVFYPHVLGVGYGATDAAIKELYPLNLLLILIVAKIVATAISLGGRFGGGVFSPSLYLGAMIGGAFGLVAAMPFPELAASHGVYAIAGMGAVASAVLGAPISTILIVFELTGDYQVVIVVMIASSVATVIARGMVGKSFFHWQLERRGISLARGRLDHLLRTKRVKDLLTGSCPKVREEETVARVRSLLHAGSFDQVLVVTAEDHYVGTIGLRQISGLGEKPVPKNATAKDIAQFDPVILTADARLDQALVQMEFSDEDIVPVVDNLQSYKVLGLVRHKDLLAAYNQALLEERTVGHK
jgi:CIC family chloride channel protein